MVMVDESSKSPLFDGGGQIMDGNEQVGGNELVIEGPCERATNNEVIVEIFGEVWRYLTWER